MTTIRLEETMTLQADMISSMRSLQVGHIHRHLDITARGLLRLRLHDMAHAKSLGRQLSLSKKRRKDLDGIYSVKSDFSEYTSELPKYVKMISSQFHLLKLWEGKVLHQAGMHRR